MPRSAQWTLHMTERTGNESDQMSVVAGRDRGMNACIEAQQDLESILLALV